MTRPPITRFRPNSRHGRSVITALAGAAVLALSACTGDSGAAAPRALDAGHWSSVLGQAKGQYVNFYAYGGDTVLNRFLSGYVTDALATHGVTLKQVKITDTVDAVNKVLGEKQAGRTSGGSVDAIWINGENFATGVQAKLWSCGWDRSLPNSRYVDFANPAVSNDFGVPVNGCEAVWQQADSALVYDSSKVSAGDVASVQALLAWATAHPGHFTYPALPDFTGSMAVRTILYSQLGGRGPLSGPFDATRYSTAASALWARLNALKPALWRGGSTYPQTQEAVEKLYSDGEISAYFTYGPGAVADKVRAGLYPKSTREAAPVPGNISNNSFLAIPANAAHRAAALVLANVLEDPQTQLALYKAEGVYPGIDLAKTNAATQAQFAAVPISPSVLPLTALTRNAQPELASGYVTHIESDWKTHVLQK
jgi:putative spermidine/putrescine transport system substrate-binding protein